MRPPGFRFRNVALVFVAGTMLSACGTYYGNNGYGGLSVGYGSAGYYDPYYSGLGYYGGSSYWGWNDGFYYPGSGYYVYDSYRRPHVWSGSQRRYWSQRRAVTGTGSAVTSTSVRPNWSGFNRSRTTARANSTITRPDRQQRAQSRMERGQSRESAANASTDRSRRKR